jgi:hypothetical protein
MTSPILSELAERVERLTGRDREINKLIPAALGYTWNGALSSANPDGRWQKSPQGPFLKDDDFTASRDAAMTLRLDWMSIETCESAAPASSPELKFTRCRIWDWRRGPLAIDPANETKAEGNHPLPLNICSAILRARASMEADHD